MSRTRVESFLLAAVAGVPVVGGSLSQIAGDEMQRRRERATEFATVIGELTEPHRPLDRLLDDEGFGLLLVAALEAAMRTLIQEKRRALARVVANAANDGAVVDQSHHLVRALRDLEGPELKTLARLSKGQRDAERDGVDVTQRLAELSGRTPAPVLAALVRHGAVQIGETADGLQARRVTAFGIDLLAFVREDDGRPNSG